jgi:L-seryl-tRNA(Ser) seleniumtransferase
MTLAALEATLRLYRDETQAVLSIPTLRMLTMPVAQIEKKAFQLKRLLENVENTQLQIKVLPLTSRAGGGALPLLELPTRCVAITLKGVSPHFIAKHMRHFHCPVIGRIEKEQFIMDLRTIREKEFHCISKALQALITKVAG